MTTIAIKDGIMAVDSAMHGYDVYLGTTSKVIEHPDGGYVGGTGHRGELEAVFEEIIWSRPLPKSEVNLLWLKSNGEIWCSEDCSAWFELQADFAAEGSGLKLAMGAMAAGASAKLAVEICCEMDVYTGGPVRTYSVTPEQ